MPRHPPRCATTWSGSLLRAAPSHRGVQRPVHLLFRHLPASGEKRQTLGQRPGEIDRPAGRLPGRENQLCRRRTHPGPRTGSPVPAHQGAQWRKVRSVCGLQRQAPSRVDRRLGTVDRLGRAVTGFRRRPSERRSGTNQARRPLCTGNSGAWRLPEKPPRAGQVQHGRHQAQCRRGHEHGDEAVGAQALEAVSDAAGERRKRSQDRQAGDHAGGIPGVRRAPPASARRRGGNRRRGQHAYDQFLLHDRSRRAVFLAHTAGAGAAQAVRHS